MTTITIPNDIITAALHSPALTTAERDEILLQALELHVTCLRVIKRERSGTARLVQDLAHDRFELLDDEPIEHDEYRRRMAEEYGL